MKLVFAIILLALGSYVCNGQDSVSPGPKAKAYGWNCFATGRPPVSRVEIEKLIKEENAEAINLWLNSSDLTAQVYGAEALIRMNNDGFILTIEQIGKIKDLKKNRNRITVCQGCILSPKKAKIALRKFRLKKQKSLA